MAFDSGRVKLAFARHPNVHENYISSGHAELLQQVRVILSFTTHCDTGLSLEQQADSAANGFRIVSDQKTNGCSHDGSGITQRRDSVYSKVTPTGRRSRLNQRAERARQFQKYEPEENNTHPTVGYIFGEEERHA
jgi:hypothetical protein